MAEPITIQYFSSRDNNYVYEFGLCLDKKVSLSFHQNFQCSTGFVHYLFVHFSGY